MKRLWKWTSMIVGLLAVIFVATLIALTQYVNPNQFKPLIIKEFNKFSGFEMGIPGDFSWSFFPHMGVTVDEMTVKKPSEFSSTLKNLVLRAKLRSLFQRKLEFSKVSIQSIQFNQLQATDVQARMNLDENSLKISPLTADFYEGSLRSDTVISFKEASPNIQLTGELRNVDVAKLLTALLEKTPSLQLNGSGSLSLEITTQGKKRDDLLKQLNGTSRFSIDNGMIQGIDIGFYVDTASALVNSQSLPVQASKNQTEFGKLTGTAIIKNGVVTNDDLVVDSPRYTTKGSGSINVVDKTLDYTLSVTAKSGQNNKMLALAGKTISIRVTGSLEHPTVTLNTLGLMQQVGKEELQKVGDRIQKAIPDKTKQFLKSLFH